MKEETLEKEPKQLTDLEIAKKLAEKEYDDNLFGYEKYRDGFVRGFKACLEQNKNLYSEKEVELIANEMVNWAIDNVGNPNPQSGKKFDEVLNKFKNK